ncbi:MAG: hypothetical protein AAGB93_16110 [Planctomycetota bacterium]
MIGLRLAAALAVAVPAAAWGAVQSGPTADPATSTSGPPADEAPRADVRITGVAGRERIDITARRMQIDALVQRIARECNREIEGLELLSRNPVVTAKLENESLRDALRYIGGSVGLRITMTTAKIAVEEDLAPYPTRSDLYARAATGYFRALVDHPESGLAPRAAWNRARIEQATPGRELEAARAFDEVTEDYPDSDLVPDALLEAGRMFGAANAWEDATARFDKLAGYPTYHDFSATARRLLADAHTRVADAARNPLVREENARRALSVLDALDDVEPTQDPEERRLRYLVRSRAHSLASQPVEALRALDLAASYSDRRVADPEIAELRALAFERADRPAEAVRAWLYYGSLVEGDARIDAFRRAAQAANDGREHLAAIAIAKAAVNQGFGDELAPYGDDAWTALDLDARRLDLFGDGDRIERAERLFEKGLLEEAADAFRVVFDRRLTLPRDLRARLGRSYARTLASDDKLDEAIVVLRKTASEIEVAATRREIYLLAAGLLETAGDLDRAIEALEGRL